jgi:hypothetical protein
MDMTTYYTIKVSFSANSIALVSNLNMNDIIFFTFVFAALDREW